jgi:hypothetical protein
MDHNPCELLCDALRICIDHLKDPHLKLKKDTVSADERNIIREETHVLAHALIDGVDSYGDYQLAIVKATQLVHEYGEKE